jgi:hypothetical protein
LAYDVGDAHGDGLRFARAGGGQQEDVAGKLACGLLLGFV